MDALTPMMKKIKDITVSAVLLILVVLTLIQIDTRIFNNQFDFDEGYNLQIALNLKEHGQYKTFDQLMDMNITTGPTVLIPGAALYSPSHPTYPRMIIAFYTLIFLFVVLTKYFSNRIEKIFYLITINLIPLFFLFSTVVLGELPGFVFLFFSYFAYSRSKYLIAGLLFALSVLTKNVYVVGVLPFIVYEIYGACAYKDKQLSLKNYGRFFTGIGIIVGIWGIFSLSQFHFHIQQYAQYLNDAVSFTRSHGKYQFGDIEKRFAMIAYTLHLGGALFTFITLFISGYMGIKSKYAWVKLLSIFTITYTLYFIGFGATHWYRHFFPAILSLLLILPQFLSSFFRSLNFERSLFALCLAIMLAISLQSYKYRDKNDIFMKLLVEQNLLFLDQTNKPYVHQKKILADQYATATFITQNISDEEKISGFAWLNSPEIAYIANRRIYHTPENDDVTYVISSIYDRFLDPHAMKNLEQLPLQEIYSNDSYRVYKKDTRTFSKLDVTISKHNRPLNFESESERNTYLCDIIN